MFTRKLMLLVHTLIAMCLRVLRDALVSQVEYFRLLQARGLWLEQVKMLTWGHRAIMFINIRIEIRRNDRLSATQ